MRFIYFSSLIFFIFLAFFYGMSSYVIIDMNEGQYAEIAREMFSTHQYLIPQLNYVPYLEKPPLFYWLLTASYHLFGVSAFAARLIPALSSALVCGAVLFFAQKTKQLKTGWLAAIILSSSIGFIIIGRVVFFDMLLTAWLTWGLLTFYLWFIHDKKFYLYLSYIFIGLAFLTKGLLPVILAGSIVVVFLLLTKTPKQKFLSFFNPLALLLFFLIILPWPILASIKLHGFAYDYFVNEQLFRFLGKRIPDDYHTGPLYFYLPRVIVYLLPWSLLILIFCRDAIYRVLTRANRDAINRVSTNLFLWLWFLIPFIFFSLSSAKGDYYMVLGAPALAYLLALKINFYLEQNKNTVLITLFILQTALLIIGAVIALHYSLLPSAINHSLIILLSYLIIYGLLGLGLIYYYRKPLLSFLLVAGLTLPLIVFYIDFRSTLQNDYTQLNLAQYIQTHNPQQKVYLFQDYEKISSLIFFLKERLTLIDSKSQDLYFGSHTPQAQGWFISSTEFKALALNKPVYVVLLKYKLDDFGKLLAPQAFCVVAENTTAVLLSNNKSSCGISALDLSPKPL